MAHLPLVGGDLGTLILLGVSILLLGISALNPQLLGHVRMGAADMMAPVLGVVTRPVQDAATVVRDISGLGQMQAENERLMEENARLREWYQTALMLEAENKSLRDLLNVKLVATSRYITARILADSGSTFVKSILVAAGANQGVEKGQAVISGEGVVGRVVEAGNRAARILLLTDVNSRVPVLVEDTSQHAVLAGQNDSLPTLVHLPPDTEIATGARIVTSGYGGIFPKGMPVGRVVVSKDGTYQVELFADFDRMVYVRVVDQPEDTNLVEGSLD